MKQPLWLTALAPIALLSAHTAHADEVSGTVVDAAGVSIAGTQVELQIGRTRYQLTPDSDSWLAVETKTATTDDHGRYRLEEVPDGGVVTAIVRRDDGIGIATGRGSLDVKLAPTGSVGGKVSGKRQDLKSLRVWVSGGQGLGGASGTVDKKTGEYLVEGLAPGEGRVHIQLDNFAVAREPVVIESGGRTKVKTVKLRGKWLPTDDPTVDCTQVKLLGPDGDPVAGVQFGWSSRWMSGGMSSDAKGMVKLAGGGVAIGGPPYRLHLRSLTGEGRAYRGALRKVRSGVALIDLEPLRKVTGRLLRGEAAVEKFRVTVVGPGDAPRIYHGSVAEGVYSVHVPTGRCRFVVGTVDGQLTEHAVEVDAGDAELVHDIRLE